MTASEILAITVEVDATTALVYVNAMIVVRLVAASAEVIIGEGTTKKPMITAEGTAMKVAVSSHVATIVAKKGHGGAEVMGVTRLMLLIELWSRLRIGRPRAPSVIAAELLLLTTARKGSSSRNAASCRQATAITSTQPSGCFAASRPLAAKSVKATMTVKAARARAARAVVVGIGAVLSGAVLSVVEAWIAVPASKVEVGRGGKLMSRLIRRADERRLELVSVQRLMTQCVRTGMTTTVKQGFEVVLAKATDANVQSCSLDAPMAMRLGAASSHEVTHGVSSTTRKSGRSGRRRRGHGVVIEQLRTRGMLFRMISSVTHMLIIAQNVSAPRNNTELKGMHRNKPPDLTAPTQSATLMPRPKVLGSRRIGMRTDAAMQIRCPKAVMRLRCMRSAVPAMATGAIRRRWGSTVGAPPKRALAHTRNRETKSVPSRRNQPSSAGDVRISLNLMETALATRRMANTRPIANCPVTLRLHSAMPVGEITMWLAVQM